MWPPWPWRSISGPKISTPQITAIRLTPIVQSQPASFQVAVAARRRRRRRCCAGCAPRRSAPASRRRRPAARTSARRRRARPRRRRWSPSARATALSSAPCSMSHSITLTPACARLVATPSPMPDAAPVTNAVLPARSFIASSPICSSAGSWSAPSRAMRRFPYGEARHASQARARHPVRGGHGQGGRLLPRHLRPDAEVRDAVLERVRHRDHDSGAAPSLRGQSARPRAARLHDARPARRLRRPARPLASRFTQAPVDEHGTLLSRILDCEGAEVSLSGAP